MKLPDRRTLCSLLAMTSLSGCDLGLSSSESSDPLLSKEASPPARHRPNWCTRWLSVVAGTVTVVLGRQAVGAGGCCASDGTYRSVEGRIWKKR